MRPAHVIEIVTPKKYLLNGLWFGPTKPKRAIIWVHGLSSSAFSMKRATATIIDKNTAVITFNNRGYGVVNKLYSKRQGKRVTLAGAAHEIFTDCVDDVEGAIRFVRKHKIQNIYLAGHSTGCQKAMYWASKKNGGRSVKGIILVAPVSDYAAGVKLDKRGKLARGIKIARALVRRGKKHTLMSANTLTTWSIDDAQRFLSLYSPDSVEEIFSYSQPHKNPKVMKKVKVPTLVLWAERDAYGDRPAREIASWFEENFQSRKSKVQVIPKAPHDFRKSERIVNQAIKQWILA